MEVDNPPLASEALIFVWFIDFLLKKAQHFQVDSSHLMETTILHTWKTTRRGIPSDPKARWPAGYHVVSPINGPIVPLIWLKINHGRDSAKANHHSMNVTAWGHSTSSRFFVAIRSPLYPHSITITILFAIHSQTKIRYGLWWFRVWGLCI